VSLNIEVKAGYVIDLIEPGDLIEAKAIPHVLWNASEHAYAASRRGGSAPDKLIGPAAPPVIDAESVEQSNA